ncbi:MAG: response regulator [Candidatus Krumholzibacteria bacterium]|nr:response regulator [Candidatus Krumholzibacteria bacterium]
MIADSRILVIDDDPVIIKSCSRVLARVGAQVEGITSGREGLRLAKHNPFDAILLDLKLPDMTGMEVLRQVKRTMPEIVVIIITGYPLVATAVKAMKLGAVDYVPKPFAPEDLTDKVKRALLQRRCSKAVVRRPSQDVKPRPLGVPPGQGRCIQTVSRDGQRIAILGLNGIFQWDSGFFSALRQFLAKANAPITTEYGRHEVQGKEILPYLEDHDRVIVIASVATGKQPGTVTKYRAADASGFASPPQFELPQIGFPHVTAWAKAIGIQCELDVVAIEPAVGESTCRMGDVLQAKLITEVLAGSILTSLTQRLSESPR